MLEGNKTDVGELVLSGSKIYFRYDAERDLFICPQDHEIPLYKRSKSEHTFVYRANAKTCDACPVKAKCTDSKSGRHLRRSFFQEYLDRAEGYRQTEAYKTAMRKRQVWVEPKFAESKLWHQGQRGFIHESAFEIAAVFDSAEHGSDEKGNLNRLGQEHPPRSLGSQIAKSKLSI